MGFFQEIRQFAHRYDPIGANLVDNAVRTDSRAVMEASRLGDRLGLPGHNAIGTLTRDEGRRNIGSVSIQAVGRGVWASGANPGGVEGPGGGTAYAGPGAAAG